MFAAWSSSGPSSYRGSPARSKKLSCPSLDAARKPARPPARRRATNPSTPALARSSQGRSSMITSTGRADATWRSSVSVAADTSNRPGGGDSLKPRAAFSASRCTALSRPNSPNTGSSNSYSPE